MSDTTTHLPATTPEWPPIARYGAVLILLVLAAIGLRSMAIGMVIQHSQLVAPGRVHPQMWPKCDGSQTGHFVFISDGPLTVTTPLTPCTPSKPVTLSV